MDSKQASLPSLLALTFIASSCSQGSDNPQASAEGYYAAIFCAGAAEAVSIRLRGTDHGNGYSKIAHEARLDALEQGAALGSQRQAIEHETRLQLDQTSEELFASPDVQSVTEKATEIYERCGQKYLNQADRQVFE